MSTTALQTTDQTKSRTSVSAPQLNSTLSAIVDSDTRVSDLPSLAGSVRSDLDRAITEFEAANVPTPPAEISRMIGKLAVLFPNAKLSDAEARAQNELYADLLSDIPQDVLGGAFRKCAQTLKFFPTVAEIRAAAMPEMAARSWRLMRMKALAMKSDREPPQPPKEIATVSDRKAALDEAGVNEEYKALLGRVIGGEA